LVAVKNFLELHEGEIEIQSKVGKGTTATIYLKLEGSK
jgi:signal transduction histidine kinase